MTWTWACSPELTDADVGVDLVTGWVTREDAEDWLKEWYTDLSDDGVQEVTLTHEGTPIYSMYLASDEFEG